MCIRDSISGTNGTIETTGYIATKDRVYADKGGKLADIDVTGNKISNGASSIVLDGSNVKVNDKVTINPVSYTHLLPAVFWWSSHGTKSCSTKKLLAMLIATGVMTCASMVPAMAANLAPEDYQIEAGNGASASGQGSVAIGNNAQASGLVGIAIGRDAIAVSYTHLCYQSRGC